MKYEPLTSIRFKDGFTSSTYLQDHILTSSVTGKICRWDLETGNLSSEFPGQEGTKFCVPYSPDINDNYTKLILQTQDFVFLFDTNNNKVYNIAQINSKCFARLSIFNSGSSQQPLIVAPSDSNCVKIFDLRVNHDTATSNHSIEIPPFKIDHPPKSELGMIHFCQPLYSLGDHFILCTYESASIAVFDIRKPTSPFFPVYITDSLEPTPSLSIWRNLLLIGDTVGDVWMFYSSFDSGIRFLKKSNLAKNTLKPPGISCLATRDDGALLVAGCWDRCLRVLETRSLELKCILDSHCYSFVDVSFQKHSDLFCSSSSDGNCHIWNIFADST